MEKKYKDFQQSWVREFSLLSSSFMGNLFCQEIWPIAGFGYNEVIFVFEKGQVACYRKKLEDLAFARWYGEKVTVDLNYGPAIAGKLISLSDQVVEFLKTNKFLTKENYQGFYGLYNNFLSHHMAVYWAADYLQNNKEDNLSAIFKILNNAWVYNEKVYPQIDKFLDETLKVLADKIKIEFDYLRTLVFDELKNYFAKDILPNKKDLQERSQLSVLVYNKKTFELYSGTQATKIKKELEPAKTAEELKGLSAMPGKAKGHVQIISKITDLAKFKPGMILVAPMTRPQYNNILKHAIAIITDEGGVLCHAAIVAREFKIPCIIGTKIATKVLKDGDMVEVDANNGIVKILK